MYLRGGNWFSHCEFVIDFYLLQQKDNVVYESNTHSIYMFSVCYNEEII